MKTVSTVSYNRDTENMQTTPAISSSEQQAKNVIKKYKNKKKKEIHQVQKHKKKLMTMT